MNRKHMPIRWKMTILSFGVVLFALIIGFIIFVGKAIEMKKEELGNQALITARTVANLPTVQIHLEESQGWKVIQPMVENIRTVNGSDYIVVLNMNRIRYSHPSDEQLGTISAGKDEGPAFAEHSYVSTAKGELGMAVRGFVPVMNADHKQIGVVVVGILLPSTLDIMRNLQNELMIIGAITLLFGMMGSWLLARQIKKDTFQLEPHEIGKLLVERTATFQAMNEGIIAIDNQQRITVFNEKAKDIVQVNGHLTGKPIQEILPSSKLPEIMTAKDPIYREEMKLGNKIVLSSRVPILVNEQIVGAVAVFQDRTEMTTLAEELTGVKEFIEALRVQTHEHQNTLHTVAGLIQLEKNEKALEYIFQSSQEKDDLSAFLAQRIKLDRLKGLLLGKIMRGKEMGIEVKIDPDSYLSSPPPLLDEHDLVILLGNFIENSFYALKKMSDESKFIHLYLKEERDTFHLEIEDNGIGMSNEQIPQLFQKGYTTKGKDGSGIGLYLIHSIVEKANGQINVESTPHEGTLFQLTFPMNGGKTHEETD
ncbi:sensor histidine kinase [Rossellomorea sp. YZS02]|uniref:sensor histidine kinase n=1 Tax=Rossellomorea sp. YZS02 TaxID=3097358 RepID=UPI002A1688FE|nr:sensor histidine kinase [Rossellomorea sp. YZS02]MDX8343160.1 sensor histidine kinase [Rossellomorea sp. YZS02]